MPARKSPRPRSGAAKPARRAAPPPRRAAASAPRRPAVAAPRRAAPVAPAHPSAPTLPPSASGATAFGWPWRYPPGVRTDVLERLV